jgi:hypothetical protein
MNINKPEFHIHLLRYIIILKHFFSTNIKTFLSSRKDIILNNEIKPLPIYSSISNTTLCIESEVIRENKWTNNKILWAIIMD